MILRKNIFKGAGGVSYLEYMYYCLFLNYKLNGTRKGEVEGWDHRWSQVLNLMLEADLDGNGTIEFPEFLELMKEKYGSDDQESDLR